MVAFFGTLKKLIQIFECAFSVSKDNETNYKSQSLYRETFTKQNTLIRLLLSAVMNLQINKQSWRKKKVVFHNYQICDDLHENIK